MTRLIRKKRGVSVVISTLLVLAITIVGAMWISNIMSTSSLTTVSQAPKAIITANSILLTAYDTRDGASLFNIANFDNKFDEPDPVLCTLSCAGASADLKPSLGGTDFIVLQVWNKNTNPIHIKTIQVNGEPHSWDTATRNRLFNGGGTTPDFPKDGMFSIIPAFSSPLIQQSSQLVEGDQAVILVIKLSSSFTSDIELGKPLQILVNIGDVQSAEFIILTGETK